MYIHYVYSSMLFKTQFSFENDVLFVFACSSDQRVQTTIFTSIIYNTMHMFSFVPLYCVCVCITAHVPTVSCMAIIIKTVTCEWINDYLVHKTWRTLCASFTISINIYYQLLLEICPYLSRLIFTSVSVFANLLLSHEFFTNFHINFLWFSFISTISYPEHK